jgi:hypothetical protein
MTTHKVIMSQDNVRRIPLSMALMVVTIILFIMTTMQLFVYSVCHWGLFRTSSLITTIIINESLPQLKDTVGQDHLSNNLKEQKISDLKYIQNKISSSGSSLYSISAWYRFTGVFTFFLSLCTLLFKPRLFGWLAFLFGVIALYLSVLIM